MVQPLGYLKESPSQTAGPYVHIGCTPNFAGIHGIFEQDLGAGRFMTKRPAVSALPSAEWSSMAAATR